MSRLMQLNQYKFECTKFHGTLSKGPNKILLKREPQTGMWFLRGQRLVVAQVFPVESDIICKKSKYLYYQVYNINKCQ